MALLGQGKECFHWLVKPPAALSGERMGVETASFQDEEGSSAALPDARGRYKGLASGYNSGAVSHSAGQRAGRQSSLCLRLFGLGPAAPFPLPLAFCLHPSPLPA